MYFFFFDDNYLPNIYNFKNILRTGKQNQKIPDDFRSLPNQTKNFRCTNEDRDARDARCRETKRSASPSASRRRPSRNHNQLCHANSEPFIFVAIRRSFLVFLYQLTSEPGSAIHWLFGKSLVGLWRGAEMEWHQIIR